MVCSERIKTKRKVNTNEKEYNEFTCQLTLTGIHVIHKAQS